MTTDNRENNEENTEHVTPMIRLDPPAATVKNFKYPVKFVAELIYLLLAFIPLTLWTLIENIFFSPRKSVRGKVVLITGSGRGLGRGFAEKFAELGCKVACADVDEELNHEMVNELNEKYPECAKAYTCNIAFADEIRELKQAVKRDFEKVDILVNNAGLLAAAPITDFDDIYLHGVITINLTSHFFMIREFLPDMLKHNEGHLVAVASVASFCGLSGASMYTATKHGVLGLMECLHYELKEIPHNRVNTSVVCPYFVNTSAFYTKIWDIRFPELSIKETVDKAVDGILRNKRVIILPGYIYSGMILLRLLPDKIIDIVRAIFYVKVIPPSKSVQHNTPLYKILIKSKDKFEMAIRNSPT